MGYGVYKVFTASMASNALVSGEFNLGRAWDVLYLDVPAMSNVQLHFQGAAETAGDFRRVVHPSVNSTTVAAVDFAIASAATNRLVPVPSGFQFVKVEATATMVDGATFKIVCGDAGE